MQWTPQQETALSRFRQWRRDGSPGQVFYLAGYAGTGKTTLAKTLAEDEASVLFAAFTGKAAHVLNMKGCPASTIHSLIYIPRDKSKQRLRELEGKLIAQLDGKASQEEVAKTRIAIEQERNNLARPAFTLNTESVVKDVSLIVIDECSMVDGQMGEDLCSFGTPVLVLGDPAQLPPVGGGGYFTEREPSFMLTDIMRQARDNPILHLAHTVREGGRLQAGAYGESAVLSSGARMDPQDALKADQWIVGKNATRHSMNRRIRSLLGHEGQFPVVGDKMVCLRNNHELGLLNGGLWTCVEAGGVEDFVAMEVQSLDIEDLAPITLLAHREPFMGEKVPIWTRRDAEEFDHGYALTCHKAQGSQWGSVMIKDESGSFRDDARRWLYTAITRAADRVTILQ